MYLALSYDHRLIDGKDAVQFLVRIKDCVESPDRMLLECDRRLELRTKNLYRVCEVGKSK